MRTNKYTYRYTLHIYAEKWSLYYRKDKTHTIRNIIFMREREL